MRKEIFICIFAIVSFIDGMKCPVFKCDNLGDGNCSQTISEPNDPILIKLNLCPKQSQICDIKFSENVDKCSDHYTTPLKYPGEYCKHKSECFSNKCEKDAEYPNCAGAHEKEPCTDDITCDTGLYCDMEKKICANASAKSCDEGNKCVANMVCNKGVCVQIASLKTGTEADISSACETFFISNGTCAKGPTLIRGDGSTGPMRCEQGICSYKTENSEFQEPCQCGKNPNGDSYCNPGKGEMADLIADVNNKCNFV